MSIPKRNKSTKQIKFRINAQNPINKFVDTAHIFQKKLPQNHAAVPQITKLFAETLEKLCRLGNILVIGVSLGNAAHKLERTECIKSPTAVLPENFRPL